MPFRLLGIVPDLESLEEIGGPTLRRYARTGVAVSVACASGADPGRLSARADLLGIQNLILLDYRPAERDSASLADLLTDIQRALRPHVVVVAGDQAMVSAGKAAFMAARAVSGKGGSLPAKLYVPVGSPSAEISTLLRAGAGPDGSQVAFRRLFPSPWVTGVVERDLFAGTADEGEPPAPLERLAG